VKLTARQLEVLRCVAAGMFDREIAADLYISRDTVRTHVQHLLGKLGARNRTHLAAIAVRRQLVA
jgi:DNA-binding NarL/FixJ family response regulator